MIKFNMFTRLIQVFCFVYSVVTVGAAWAQTANPAATKAASVDVFTIISEAQRQAAKIEKDKKEPLPNQPTTPKSKEPLPIKVPARPALQNTPLSANPVDKLPSYLDLVKAELYDIKKMLANSKMYVFLSYSMPDAVLLQHMIDAKKVGATVVFKGFIDNKKEKETKTKNYLLFFPEFKNLLEGNLKEIKNEKDVQQFTELSKTLSKRRGALMPAMTYSADLFEEYKIKTVPAVVLRASTEVKPRCDEKQCNLSETISVVYGDIPMEQALNVIGRSSTDQNAFAKHYLEKLKTNADKKF